MIKTQTFGVKMKNVALGEIFLLTVSLYKRFIVFVTLYVPCIMFQCVDKPTRCKNADGLFAVSYEFRLLQVKWGHAVAQLVEALRYKPEGRGFESRWCHWNFSLT